MRPAARIQAAIEILDLVIAAARGQGASADRILADWFRERRYAGSKDRRAIRDLVYRAIRVCGEIPPGGRAAMLALAADDEEIAAGFDGSAYGPAPVAPDERVAEAGIAPAWLISRLADSGVGAEEATCLLDRAPLDIRINTLKADATSIELPVAGEATAIPSARRMPAGTPVEQWEAYLQGQIEVQDAGSQMTCLAMAAQPGETVIDLCAGAGGKTLALAAAMENRGTLIASDIDRARLSRLAPRAERAGVSIAQTVLLNPGQEAEGLGPWIGKADAVLIDAPCSGTGTWRRNPEARWRLTEAQLQRYCQAQDMLLGLASRMVRPGGRIVYVTCSLLDAEGADRIAAFLAAYPGWRAERPDLPAGSPRGEGTRLSPLRDGTDGFFVARLVSL